MARHDLAHLEPAPLPASAFHDLSLLHILLHVLLVLSYIYLSYLHHTPTTPTRYLHFAFVTLHNAPTRTRADIQYVSLVNS